jgi:adenine-specific DNA methylase
MLMALLLPDPCDTHCPAEFKTQAQRIMEDSRLPGRKPKTDADLRARLLDFIGDFADWDHSGNRAYLEVARGLVRAAHPDELPLVVDPFAGGGSIPLEALRLGCDAFASDLNPVACLINKVLLEDIPRNGPELAEELRHVGAEVKKAAERELAEFYPVDPDGARPIAYLWARTVRCETPHCGAVIPLMRSFWLSKKGGRRQALRYRLRQSSKHGPSIELEVFEPKNDKEVPPGTVSLAKATCPVCDVVLTPDRVRAQLRVHRGGADAEFDGDGRRVGGARIVAVVTLRPQEPGRHYRSPADRDYQAVWKAQGRLAMIRTRVGTDGKEVYPTPDEPTPQDGTGSVGGGFRTRKYGLQCFGDFFTARQSLALLTLSRLVREHCASHESRDVLALVLGRLADYMSAQCVWHIPKQLVAHTFGRQALPFTWDFCEIHPLADGPGNFTGAVEWASKVVESWFGKTACVPQVADAAEHPLPDDSATVWFTDPPYYDSVPYADLSDYFFVWLKRILPTHPLLRDPFDPTNRLTPKLREAVRDEQEHLDGRPKKSVGWYEQRMARAFAEGRRVLHEDGIGSVVFAHKTTEGWEALLGGLIRGGWTITGSWPISTEMATRLRARESAALATSVHLVCRPRPEDAPVGDWGQVLRELPKRVADWMNRLQEEGVRGADLVFACIGPALEIYSRYSKVVDAEEREIPLGGNPEAREPHKRGYLAYVWEVVGRAALEQVLGTAEAKARNGAAGALEEDARLTALFLWTLQATTQDSASPSATDQDEDEAEPDDEDEVDTPKSKKKKKGLTLPFDVARRFSQPLGIHLDAWEGRCIETEKGIVRLIPVLARAEQLFGKEGADAVADRLEKHRAGPIQPTLFPVDDDTPPTPIKGRKRRGADVSDESLRRHRGATTLEHVHAAMLLQSSGRANALRALLKAETERGPDFLRLANALSALYPKDSDEKRLLDAMLLAVPR